MKATLSINGNLSDVYIYSRIKSQIVPLRDKKMDHTFTLKTGYKKKSLNIEITLRSHQSDFL